MKYLACAHIDLKNELAVLHQMIQRLLDESLLNKVDQQVSNDILPSTIMTTTTTTNGIDSHRIHSKMQIFDNQSRKSSPIVESDYDNTTIIEDPENPIGRTLSVDKRSSRSMQRFPPVEETTNLEGTTRSFRSTDFVNSNGKDIEIPVVKTHVSPVGNGRARSCSGGRNKTVSSPHLSRKSSCGQNESNGDIDKRTRKITHRIAELFSLIKENQSDRYVLCAERIHSSVQDMIRLFDRFQTPLNEEIRSTLDLLNTGAQQLLAHANWKDKSNRSEQIQLMIDDCYNIALATKSLVNAYQKL